MIDNTNEMDKGLESALKALEQAKVRERKGRLELPIVSGKYLRKMSDRTALQSAAYAEVIGYNKKNLERELQNESGQQGKTKRRGKEI